MWFQETQNKGLPTANDPMAITILGSDQRTFEWRSTMKTQSLTVLAIGLLLGSGASHAGDQADARALLDKAMKAMNGEAKLAKLGTASVKGKITGSEGGE